MNQTRAALMSGYRNQVLHLLHHRVRGFSARRIIFIFVTRRSQAVLPNHKLRRIVMLFVGYDAKELSDWPVQNPCPGSLGGCSVALSWKGGTTL